MIIHPGNRCLAVLSSLFCGVILLQGQSAAGAEMPRLQENHGAWQLMVDGKPFLMRGGEFANNVYEAPQDIQHLGMTLNAYKSYDMNTLLVPITWRSLEPRGPEKLRVASSGLCPHRLRTAWPPP